MTIINHLEKPVKLKMKVRKDFFVGLLTGITPLRDYDPRLEKQGRKAGEAFFSLTLFLPK
jgi:hypothetical protein